MLAPLLLAASATAVALNASEVVYTPFEASCPALNTTLIDANLTHSGFIRENFGISEDEYAWISARQVKTQENLISFLDGLNMTDYANVSFADYLGDLNQSAINIGLSFSGGGFRALLLGAGELSALDSRSLNDSALSGLLDSSSYISGLSGGSIMLSTLLNQNWSSVDDIVYGNSTLWNMTASPFPSSISAFEELLTEVSAKKEMGYQISLVDLFGRILSRYMFEEDQNEYGLDALWSDIQYSAPFVNFDMPFPIILATGGGFTNMTGFESNPFEINPFEFGSWSPYVGGFVPIELMGSLLNNGVPENQTSCTYEFDNVGFLVGTSSNILADFEEIIDEVLSGKLNISGLDLASLGLNVNTSALDLSPATLELLVDLINADYQEITYGILDNPFYNYTTVTNDTSEVVDDELLYLADGGLFGETIPIDPFLVPSRELDVFFAFDNSAASPNGSCLYASEERWLESYPNDTFYQLPAGTEEFVELGLNLGPVFFGCNGSDLITHEQHPDATANFTYMKPLLVYVPNVNISDVYNISGYQYTYAERNDLVKNGFELAQGDEPEFAECVGCAIIRRAEERLGLDPSPNCAKCFEQYCYIAPTYEDNFNVSAPVVSESKPTSIYSPTSFGSSLLNWRSTRSAYIASVQSVDATRSAPSVTVTPTAIISKPARSGRVHNDANTTLKAATET